ncbi:MAG: hypothetical protein UT30_C0011G0050 [Candidatus Uhrbacteria bacterium GW2011_GWF2_39_13]|uniref:Uncharacterized protein n=1 Tax=Candidatus Uhrbacteria bacterium GW2011_GWF2_39_13 TaxID=1618995 RepID=A0A0G0MJK5_9BACT|nr:MAG: hypothetical protein UT30_C0011G0050 [Candidatus Uhrbacteria bacterium GW2011_GWF2_39_13]HAU66623.1 hypothetical protein [Candidatus Uhrbacteria bacterium]
MDFFHILQSVIHSVGEASEGSQGWFPSAIGSALGLSGGFFESAVKSKIQQNQQDQSSADQRLQDRANSLP